MAEFEQSAMLEAIAEQLDGLHCIFALSMRTSPDLLDDIPDLIGLPIQKPSLPWTSQSIATATKTLLATLAQLTPEPNREQQLDYYREQHRLIRLND